MTWPRKKEFDAPVDRGADSSTFRTGEPGRLRSVLRPRPRYQRIGSGTLRTSGEIRLKVRHFRPARDVRPRCGPKFWSAGAAPAQQELDSNIRGDRGVSEPRGLRLEPGVGRAAPRFSSWVFIVGFHRAWHLSSRRSGTPL